MQVPDSEVDQEAGSEEKQLSSVKVKQEPDTDEAKQRTKKEKTKREKSKKKSLEEGEVSREPSEEKEEEKAVKQDRTEEEPDEAEGEDELNNNLKQKFLKEKERQARREQRRREKRDRKKQLEKEQADNDNEDTPKVVYYDFEKNKKSSGVFLHNLIEEPEEQEPEEPGGIELASPRRKDKPARTKKLKSLTQRLSFESQASELADLSVIHEQYSSLSDIHLPEINTQKAAGSSMQVDSRSRSKKLVALSVLKGADVNSMSRQEVNSSQSEGRDSNPELIRLSKADPRYQDLMSRVTIEDTENITVSWVCWCI